jgi:hypothetical protein
MTSSSSPPKSETCSARSSDTEADDLVSVAARKLAEEEDICELLEERLGRLHARLHLGIEADHEAHVFGQGMNYFHLENSRSSHFVIRTCLRLTGLYERGSQERGAGRN